MPRATVTHETVRRELKTCPGGYVELRTLTFHEMNTRQDIALRMYQERSTPKKGQKRQTEETVRAYMDIANVAVTEYEFRNCIHDHNLEDENGDLIDFTKPMQAWRLDPKIGQEINNYIDELNQWEEDDEDLTPLGTPASSSSSGELSTFPTSTVPE